MIDTILNK